MSKGWKAFETDAEYKIALDRTVEIFHAEDTLEGAELELLLALIKDYENRNYMMANPEAL